MQAPQPTAQPTGWPHRNQSQAHAHVLAPTSTPPPPVMARSINGATDTAATSTMPRPPPPPSSAMPASALPLDSPKTMMDVDDDRARRAASVLSMDDIEAAQALEGLRSDFVHSPPSHPTALPQAHSQQQQLSASPNQPHNGHPEPLLSLLTSTHPLISSAINGSMSAYESSKSYSTRFKYGAEFLERNIGSPVANTVGTVSRKTGVEGGLRWAFQRRDTNELGEPNKRRKTEDSSENTDMEKTMMQRDRSTSDTSYSETLPPYDDHKSPSYEEVNSSDQMANDSAQNQRSWHNRLVISTSGLGVAMSDESLRRLAYCLKWLKWANERLNNAVLALKNALHKWEERSADENSSQNRAMLSQHIQAVREDVLRTLRQVVDIVSKYTGGALPENARNLVRRHLVSLPQRFKLASTSDSSVESGSATSDEATSARRVLVLAQEGLDMMTQVHRVVDDTLVSAQTWCERLNRKMPDLENGQHDAPPAAQDSRSMPMDIKPPIIETANREVEMTDSDAV